MSCLSFSYGQETIFLETCGTTDISSPKKVDTYTGWDNSAPVTFTRTTTLDGYADVRITTSMTNHVWFPYEKSSDLIISNIPTANYHNLKLSFDIAAYKLTDANVNKLSVLCNDSALTIPSETFTSSKFITVSDIELNNSETITLKFQYSAENNTNGYRLDNFKISGDKVTSDVHNPSVSDFNPFISGNNLILSNITDGTTIEVYNILGTLIQSSVLNGRSIELNRNMTKGMYIIRAGKHTAKVTL
jgi:hypothetical protein